MATMRSVSGEFEQSRWVIIMNWGRGVVVGSVDDIDEVHRLMAAPGSDRRAVIFERQSATRRWTLISALESAGLALRPFGDTDRAVTTVRPSGIARLVTIAALPYLVIMRLSGRSTRIYEVTRTPESIPHPLR